jgi:hypothetical protein
MNAWTVKECHITVGSSRPLIGRWRDNSPPSPPLSSQHHRRLGRQGLARRRDTSSSSTSATSGSVASTWQKSHMLTGMCHLLSSDLFWLCDVLSKTAHGSRQPLYLAGVRGFLSWFEEGQRVMLTTYLHTCVRYIRTLQCGRYRAVVFRKLTAVSLVAQPEKFDK